MKKMLILIFCFSFGLINAQQTIEIPIVDGNDDAYSSWDGWNNIMFIDTDSLVMGSPDSPSGGFMIGLRYQSIPIPPGSTIESANIQFTPFKANDELHCIRISCEKNINPPTFTSEDNNIWNRDKESLDQFWWTSAWDWIANDNSKTIELKELVQYLVDMEGWVENNSMVFIFSYTLESSEHKPKLACSYEYGAEWYAPSLTITFTAPASVSELQVAKQVNVFPNPVSDRFTLSFEELEKGEYSISLFDLQGRKVHEVYSGLLTSGDHQFNVSTDELKLEQGIYLLSIHSSRSDISRKIIVR